MAQWGWGCSVAQQFHSDRECIRTCVGQYCIDYEFPPEPLVESPTRPLPFSAAPPPPESELHEVKRKIADKEQEIAGKKEEVNAAAEDVRFKEAVLPTPLPETLTEQQKKLLDRLCFAEAKEQSLRDELAALRGELAALQGQLASLRGLLLELQKEKNLLLASSASPGAKLADEAVQRFWRELPNAKLQGDMLVLPAGVFFLGDAQLGSTLYVRPEVYELLWQEMLHQRASEKISRLVLTGTPGIGKSRFLLGLGFRV